MKEGAHCQQLSGGPKRSTCGLWTQEQGGVRSQSIADYGWWLDRVSLRKSVVRVIVAFEVGDSLALHCYCNNLPEELIW
jgi:hypothetical protein